MQPLLLLLACASDDAQVLFGDLGVDQTWNKCCDDSLMCDPEVLWTVRIDPGDADGTYLLTYEGRMPGQVGDSDWLGEVALQVDQGLFVTRSTAFVDELPSEDRTANDYTREHSYDPPLQVAPARLRRDAAWTVDSTCTQATTYASGTDDSRSWSVQLDLELGDVRATDFGDGLVVDSDGIDASDWGLHFLFGPDAVWVRDVGPVATRKAIRPQ